MKIHLTLLSKSEILERFNTRSKIPFNLLCIDKKEKDDPIKIKFNNGDEKYTVALSKTGKFSSVFDGFFDLVLNSEYRLPTLSIGTKILAWNSKDKKKECYFAGCGLNGDIGCTFFKPKKGVDIGIVQYFQNYRIIDKERDL